MEPALRAMPFLIINLSGEMLYILDQRLRAQKVAPDKADRVREDLTSKLVEEGFLLSLFEPQKLYTFEACKSLYQVIVHSSIMKLNPTSMSKLFDLMFMGVKMQALCVKYPDELLHVTINHIEHIIDLVKNPGIKQLLRTRLLERFTIEYASYKPYQFAKLRHVLLDFFIDKNICVSLFMSDQLQSEDGSLLIDLRGEMPPGIADLPITVVRLGAAERVVTRSCVRPISIEGLAVSTVRDRVNERRTLLGINVYADSQPDIRAHALSSGLPTGLPSVERTSSRHYLVSQEESKKATTWELDILADFTGLEADSYEPVVALHRNDFNSVAERETPVSKAKVSARLISLKAQFADIELTADKDNEANFFS